MYTNEAIASFLEESKLPLAYLYYVLPKFVIENASTNIYGARILNQELICNAHLLAPTFEEAQHIANFLDHETAKIDTLIEKQQQLIQLLKEKRQAVISHAVTKGLNPDAPMRDSGVEWLGEVPEHWEVKRLKNTSNIVDCRNKTPEYFEDGEYFVVRTTNIKQQKLSFDGALYTNEPNFRIWTQRGIPPAGSILFTREAPAGEVCLVPENLKFCMGQRMMNFICFDPDYTNYLFDFLLSDCLERYIESVSHGSTVSHLRVEQVENIPVLVPPKNEAQQIHNNLKVIKTKYLKLTQEAEKAISFMQERRTALISAAVTGKIDVRNWQAPEPVVGNHQTSKEALA
jgi:type I restriction enzyme S subunit